MHDRAAVPCAGLNSVDIGRHRTSPCYAMRTEFTFAGWGSPWTAQRDILPAAIVRAVSRFEDLSGDSIENADLEFTTVPAKEGNKSYRPNVRSWSESRPNFGTPSGPLNADTVDKVPSDRFSGVAIEKDFQISSIPEANSADTHTEESASTNWLQSCGPETLSTVSARNGHPSNVRSGFTSRSRGS